MHELAVAQPSLISLKQIPIVRFKAGKPYRSMPGFVGRKLTQDLNDDRNN
jgi:hypothetical protein